MLPMKEVQTVATDRFFVAYDAGETNAFIPIFKQLEAEGKEFKFLVMGTAATIIKPDMFIGKRIELQDLNVSENVDKDLWKREQKLSKESMQKICRSIDAKAVIVGTASRIQRQFLKKLSGAKIAFCDNFYYDKTQEVFKTVNKVQEVAQKVLCPSENLICLFGATKQNSKYEVVGKPTLKEWEKEIKTVDKDSVLKKLHFETDIPVITMVGGYGPGYDEINPLYKLATEELTQHGYQVLIQPHPKVEPQKVKTAEALAVADYVVGYNSSVVFDSALIGKQAIYYFPITLTYDHFAIQEGLVPKASTFEELVKTLESMHQEKKSDLLQQTNIPKDSVERIIQIIDRYLIN